jgi:alkylation response protein AidB-like acyl-CoA dehydrogenase
MRDEWDEDQRALREAVLAMAEVLSKGHIEADRDHEFPRDKWDRLAETGLFALPFPESFGGLGQDLPTTMYVLEGLGYACRDAGLSFSASTHLVSAGIPVLRFGSQWQREHYLPRICDGSLIGGHAITEPDGGSDIMSMRTTATAAGDDFVLTGGKTFVSNGPVAGVFVVYARTGRRGSPAALTAFLVEAGTPGLVVGRPLDKMGLRTSPMSELFLEDCLVPGSHVVGAVGSGFLVLDHVMKWEILCSFAITVGEMRHRYERCVEQAGTRVQFGRPIGDNQAVSHRLVDMLIGLESSRRWLFDTAEKFAARRNISIDLAIAKLVTSENNVASALTAIQLFGGNGYMSEYGIEKELRNAVAGTIYSGTSEIQRQRIAALIGL